MTCIKGHSETHCSSKAIIIKPYYSQITEVCKMLNDIFRNMSANTELNMAVFWDVVPFSLVDIGWRFRGAYCLHYQGDESVSTRLHSAASQKTAIFMYVAMFEIYILHAWYMTLLVSWMCFGVYVNNFGIETSFRCHFRRSYEHGSKRICGWSMFFIEKG
jgi:hypothetical protein